MSDEFGLTATGFRAPRVDEILARIQQNYAENDGIDTLPDFSRDTFLGAITTAIAIEIGEAWDSVQQLYDGFDPNNASGLLADSVNALVGVTRRRATQSTALVNLGGTAGTIVPAGKIVTSAATGVQWRTLEDATIPATGIAVEATLDGAFAAPAGSIDTILTPVTGWTTVTNPAPAEPGRNRETDEELRIRRLDALQGGTSRTTAAIKSQVEALAEVDSALVVENDTDASVVKEGITLPPKSLSVVVYPPSISADAQQQIAETINLFKAAGIATIGSTSVVITGLDDNPKTINFNLASVVAVDVDITVTISTGFTLAQLDSEIRSAVAAYFAGLAPGQDVRRLPLYAAIDAIDGVVSADILLNSLDADVTIGAVNFATANTPIGVTT